MSFLEYLSERKWTIAAILVLAFIGLPGSYALFALHGPISVPWDAGVLAGYYASALGFVGACFIALVSLYQSNLLNAERERELSNLREQVKTLTDGHIWSTVGMLDLHLERSGYTKCPLRLINVSSSPVTVAQTRVYVDGVLVSKNGNRLTLMGNTSIDNFKAVFVDLDYSRDGEGQAKFRVVLDLSTLGGMPYRQVIEFGGKSFGPDWSLLEVVSYDTRLEAGWDLDAGA